jgi:hypothetical protein
VADHVARRVEVWAVFHQRHRVVNPVCPWCVVEVADLEWLWVSDSDAA